MPQVQRRSVEGDRPAEGEEEVGIATIQAVGRQREERAAGQQMEAPKDRKEREKLNNAEKDVVGDVDFVRMISAWRDANKDQAKPHARSPQMKPRKMREGPSPSVCASGPSRGEGERKTKIMMPCLRPPRPVVVHDCQLRVDGISGNT